MSSENSSGADNQQERPSFSNWLDQVPVDVGHYIAGFVDGEGSFNIPIRRESRVSSLSGRQLLPAGTIGFSV